MIYDKSNKRKAKLISSHILKKILDITQCPMKIIKPKNMNEPSLWKNYTRILESPSTKDEIKSRLSKIFQEDRKVCLFCGRDYKNGKQLRKHYNNKHK